MNKYKYQKLIKVDASVYKLLTDENKDVDDLEILTDNRGFYLEESKVKWITSLGLSLDKEYKIPVQNKGTVVGKICGAYWHGRRFVLFQPNDKEANRIYIDEYSIKYIIEVNPE